MTTMPPPRKPYELEKLDGYPGKGRRKTKEQCENLPDIGPVGEPFPDMSERAQAKWHELSREWHLILKRTDRDFLRLFCETWVDMIDAQTMVSAFGITTETTVGTVRISPHAKRLQECRESIRRLLCEVGATPAARTKVEMETEMKPKSKFDGLVN